ncbi:hypothetical protein [Actinophytocola oryzae]|uniref:Uncharacterized protein n=1 Tax=Actinophytocola oryzae TaxID=502181 RepID=A0A4R7W3S9_9PSEU|nr:hypothetical protein [Actinophytocola oryzae]TDV57330.1 hypothetical protein CLV71_101201 [Actinophytocola oryzae]
MIRRALTLLVAVVATVLLGASPAWAHGGPIDLDVRSDGGQGITVTAVYLRDHHYVPVEVVMTYTAVDRSGKKTIGPVRLRASSEGQSFYVSEKPLPLGDWTVTVTSTSPSAAQKTISITSEELPPVGTSRTPAPSGLSTATLVAIPVAVAVVGLVVALLLRRRRQTRAPA